VELPKTWAVHPERVKLLALTITLLFILAVYLRAYIKKIWKDNRLHKFTSTFHPLYKNKNMATIQVRFHMSLKTSKSAAAQEQMVALTNAALVNLFASAKTNPTISEINQAINSTFTREHFMEVQIEKVEIMILEAHYPWAVDQPSKTSGIWT
jgi:hypothetical protein